MSHLIITSSTTNMMITMAMTSTTPMTVPAAVTVELEVIVTVSKCMIIITHLNCSSPAYRIMISTTAGCITLT